MRTYDLDPIGEGKLLTEDSIYKTRSFLVTIEDTNGKLLMRPYVISNFSTDKNKVFLTLFDVISKDCIEKLLDEWYKGWLFFKKKVNITLYRLDITNTEIYRVVYKNCILKNYHGKNFTYKGNDLHQWYLEFKSRDKLIIEDAEDKIKPNVEDVKKAVSILENSNKMLDDAAQKVKNHKTLSEANKMKVINEISKAKKENKQREVRFIDTSLGQLEKNLKTVINEMEEKINQ